MSDNAGFAWVAACVTAVIMAIMAATVFYSSDMEACAKAKCNWSSGGGSHSCVCK